MSELIQCGTTGIRVAGRLLRMARLDADRYLFLRDPEPLIDALRGCGVRADVFTFMQGLADPEPKYCYPMEWDNLAALPVSTYENWWQKQIGTKARNHARQAGKKGVEIREVAFDDELACGIWQIYNECPVRQGRRFRHYGAGLDAVRKMEATYLDSSIFLGAFLDKELIGFIKMVVDTGGVQAGMMNILSKIAHRDKSPTNALVARAVEECAKRGIRYLVYDRYAYGGKQHDGLVSFKEQNGFVRVDLPRYYVPLTGLGRLAVRLGLHHRVADRVPESIKRRLRTARTQWLRSGAQAL